MDDYVIRKLEDTYSAKYKVKKIGYCITLIENIDSLNIDALFNDILEEVKKESPFTRYKIGTHISINEGSLATVYIEFRKPEDLTGTVIATRMMKILQSNTTTSPETLRVYFTFFKMK